MKELYLCGAVTKNPNYKQDFEMRKYEGEIDEY